MSRATGRWLCEATGEAVAERACLACSRERRYPACPMAPGVIAALVTTLREEPELRALRAQGIAVVRVTELVGCARKAWYGLREERPLEKASAHWARFRGTVFHEALARLASLTADVLVERRLFFDGRPHGLNAVVTGRLDGYDTAQRRLWDLKTTNGKLPAEPYSHHVRQLQLYSWLLVESGYEPPRELCVVYATMAELGVRTCPVPTDYGAVRAGALARLQSVVARQAPAGDPEAWECGYCPWATRCPEARR